MSAGPKTFRCARCSVELVFDPDLQPAGCDFCGNKSLALLEAPPAEPAPQFVIPFTIDAEGARRRFLDWIGSGLWYPREILRQFHEAEFVGVYLPTYQFTCRVRTEVDTQAEEGPSTPGTHGDTGPAARPAWLSQEGSHAGYYNERISASRGLTRDEVQRLLPYNYRSMRPFVGDTIAGMKRERAGHDEEHCWEVALKNIGQMEKAAMRAAGGGRKKLTLDCLEKKTYLILVPVWVLGYTWQGRYYRALMNGQSGRVCEIRQLAPLKVGVCVACGAASLLSGLVLLLSTDGEESAGAAARPAARAAHESAVPVWLRLHPNMTFAGYRGAEVAAGDATERIVKQSWAGSRNDLSETLQQARDIARAGNVVQAEELLLRVVQGLEAEPARRPDAARLRVELGQILLHAGQAGRAAQEAETVLKDAPKDAHALALLGCARAHEGRFADAAAAWRSAYDEDSSDLFFLLAAGHLHRLMLKDPEAAKKCYRDFLEEPDGAPAAKLIGLVLKEMEGKTDDLAADVVTLKNGGVVKGEIVSKAGGVVRVRLRDQGGAREGVYPLAEVASIGRGPSDVKVDLDGVLAAYDEVFVKGQGDPAAAEYVGLARQAAGHAADYVQALAPFFALLALLADPQNADARALLTSQGYSVSHTRLVKRPTGEAK